MLQSLGLPPHHDYAVVEQVFGDAAAEACDVQFQFGYKGKPLYVSGSTESPTQIRRRLERLRRKLGDDGFDFVIPAATVDDLEELEDEDDDVERAYDPAVARDPAEWLALDEEERIRQTEDFHRRGGDASANRRIHAILHAIVETQIARGDESPVRRAIERLMAGGVNRHQAIHALAAVFTDHLLEAMDEEAKSFPAQAYNDAIERLSAEGWLRQLENAGG